MFKKKENQSSSLKKKKYKEVTITKDEYAEIQKEKKESKFKRLKEYARLLNFRNLNTHIQKYGYNYSFGKYMVFIVILMALTVLSSHFFKMQLGYTTLLAMWSIFLLPIIIISQIRFLYNNKRFDEMTTYLQEAMPIFETNPKILYCLKEVADLYENGSQMKKTLQKAIDCIEKQTSGTQTQDIYAKGLSIIEKEYPCSRIASLHRLMLTVENQNSEDYHDSLSDLSEDVRAWITRTYAYQLDLKNLKNQFNIVVGLTIFVAALIVNILPDILTSFVSNPIYQVVTMLMLGSFILMFVIVQSKLNGQWLVNDIEKDDRKILRSIHLIENWDSEKKKKESMILAGICSVIPVIGFIMSNRNVIIIGVISVAVMYFWNDLQYKSAFASVKKEIEKNFPIWLRDVSLNMHNLVVTRALKQSLVTAPTVIQYYLNELIGEIEKDPVTIRPYNNFLKKFYIPDVNSAMKSLYSIKMNSSQEASKKISDLILRNQDMMEKSEQIRNKNNLTGVTLLGYLPMIIGCGKMIIDMLLMLFSFMTNMTVF